MGKVTLITVEGLSVAFEGRTVFKDLDFKVNQGEYLCIVGENGSGKTTLMRCLIGADIRYSGKIEYHGFSRKDIGWLPQRSENKRDFPASVYEVVMSGFAGKAFLGFRYTAQNRKKAQECMEMLEIMPLKNRAFKELSGGQQQRVLLCRALCAAEKVILLDEPVNGLDSFARDEFYGLVRELNKNGMTVIMISHDTERAVADADKVLCIYDNGYFLGSPEEMNSELGGVRNE